MSEQNDDAPPPKPPDEPPPSSPFPDSSLTPPADDPPAPPPPPPPMAPSVPDPPAPAPPAPPVPPAPPESRPWMETPPAPPAPDTPAFPPGYTSPPPPGAGFPATPAPSTITAPAPGSHVLAGWGRRVGAFVIDLLVLLIPFLLILSVLGLGFFADDEGAGDGIGGFIVAFFLSVLAFLVVALLYAPVMMAATNGKTLGRMATGIRVIRAGGEPITFGFAAMREIVVKGLLINAVGGALTAGLAWVIDSLWPLWDDENRALHDFIVNTRTVMDRP